MKFNSFLVTSFFIFSVVSAEEKSALKSNLELYSQSEPETRQKLFSSTDEWVNKYEWERYYRKLEKYKRRKDYTPDTEFWSDGCSGGVSTVWNEMIVPLFSREYDDSKPIPDDIKDPSAFPLVDCCIPHDKNYYYADYVSTSYPTKEVFKDLAPSCAEVAPIASEIKSPKDSLINRRLADCELMACIATEEHRLKMATAFAQFHYKKDHPKFNEKRDDIYQSIDIKQIAKLFYLGVRLGGGPCTPASYRWGYGYDECD